MELQPGSVTTGRLRYFNLRGWRQIDRYINDWSGIDGNACRLLVGMHQSPDRSIREKLSAVHREDSIDNAKVIELKKELAADFRTQLSLGVPNNDDEAGLRRLAKQIRAKKVVVKLFLKHPLHAKLYLLHRPDPINPKLVLLVYLIEKAKMQNPFERIPDVDDLRGIFEHDGTGRADQLARNGLVEHRLARRANALALLDQMSCSDVERRHGSDLVPALQ